MSEEKKQELKEYQKQIYQNEKVSKKIKSSYLAKGIFSKKHSNSKETEMLHLRPRLTHFVCSHDLRTVHTMPGPFDEM